MLQPEGEKEDTKPEVFAVNQAIQRRLSYISSGMTSTYSMKCFNLHATTSAVFMGAVCFVFDPGTGLEVCCSSDFVPWPRPFPIYIRGSDIAIRPMPWPNFSLHRVLVGDFTSYVLSSIDRVFIHNEQHQFLPRLLVVINIDYFLWTPPWFYLCGHPIRWTSVVVLMEFLGVQQFIPVIALVVGAFGWIDDASLGSGISFLSIHFAATVLILPSNQFLLWQQQQAAFQHINFHSTADKHLILLYCFAHVLSSTIELALKYSTQAIAISWLSMFGILVATLCSRSMIHLSGFLASGSKDDSIVYYVIDGCLEFMESGDTEGSACLEPWPPPTHTTSSYLAAVFIVLVILSVQHQFNLIRITNCSTKGLNISLSSAAPNSVSRMILSNTNAIAACKVFGPWRLFQVSWRKRSANEAFICLSYLVLAMGLNVLGNTGQRVLSAQRNITIVSTEEGFLYGDLIMGYHSAIITLLFLSGAKFGLSMNPFAMGRQQNDKLSGLGTSRLLRGEECQAQWPINPTAQQRPAHIYISEASRAQGIIIQSNNQTTISRATALILFSFLYPLLFSGRLDPSSFLPVDCN